MKYSKLGYKRYSPDLYKRYNIIPSGRITMKDVDFPVFGVDNLGNQQMMYPEQEYQFPGNQVFELPMAQGGFQYNGSWRDVAPTPDISERRDATRVAPPVMVPQRVVNDRLHIDRANQRDAGTISQYVAPKIGEQVVNKLANPMTTLGYIARGESIPDMVPVRDNTFDMAMDIINPASYVEAGMLAKNDIQNDNYLGAAVNAAGFFPFVPTFSKKTVGNLMRKPIADVERVIAQDYTSNLLRPKTPLQLTEGTRYYRAATQKSVDDMFEPIVPSASKIAYDNTPQVQGLRFFTPNRKVAEHFYDVNRMDFSNDHNRLIRVDMDFKNPHIIDENTVWSYKQIKDLIDQGHDAIINFGRNRRNYDLTGSINDAYEVIPLNKELIRNVEYLRRRGGEQLPMAQPGGEFDPEMMFRDKYNTQLKPREKRRFNRWVAKESQRQGRDILMDAGAYDVQGFWKSGDYKRMDQDNHGSDTWKKPNHPTFSNQSRYHGADGWYGGNWTEDGGYQPSKQTLQMYDPGYYEWMFGTEPNRLEHLDMSRYESGINAPTPMYYQTGGDLEEYGKGGLTQWFAEKWVDVKTGKECGRSGKDKNGRPYPACRPSKRVNETTPKTASEMSSSEKAKFKREKTSGKRINYNHKRAEDGGVIPQAQMGLFFNPVVQTGFDLGHRAGQAIKGWFNEESSDLPVQQTQTQVPQKQPAQPTGFNDNEFLYRQAYQESRFDPNAKSPAGYSGLTQIGEGIITDYQKATGDTRSNPFDPDFAIAVQKWAMDKYLNNTPWIRGTDEVKRAKALASYNWGPGNTKKALEKLKADGVDIYNNLDWISGLPTETQSYINHIMGLDYSDEPQWEESYTTAKKKSPYSNYYRQVGGEKKEFDDSVRDRIVDRVNEIVAREDYYHLPPGLAKVVKEQGSNPDNETCIGGVCRVYRDTGVMEEIIPKNTEFARRAPELGFTRGFKLGALKPGDMLQHMGNTNNRGKPYPSHAQLFVGMNDDGKYVFFDNFEGTNTWGYAPDGKQDGIRTYTAKQMEKFLKRGIDGKVDGASIYHLDPNAANYLTEEEARIKAIRDANRSRRLPLETEIDANYTGDAYYQEVSESKDIPYYYGSGRSQDDRDTYPIATKNEDKLLRLFNSQEMDQRLIDMFNITDQSLNRLKPLIYGIMWQESNFGEPKSIGASIKYAGESLLGTSKQSTGIPSVKYSQLRDFVKKELAGRESLNSAEGAYIAALDMLLQSGNYSDSHVSADKNPELLGKDPWVPALYFYNGQGRGLSRGRASDNTPMRADKGSYPDKIMRYADKLKVGIPFDADLGNLDVYRNPYEVIVTPERQQRYGGGIPRYSGKLYR